MKYKKHGHCPIASVILYVLAKNMILWQWWSYDDLRIGFWMIWYQKILPFLPKTKHWQQIVTASMYNEANLQDISWTASATAMVGRKCLWTTIYSPTRFWSQENKISIIHSSLYHLLSYKLTNLSCGSVYSFNLIAHNIAGRSKPRWVISNQEC